MSLEYLRNISLQKLNIYLNELNANSIENNIYENCKNDATLYSEKVYSALILLRNENVNYENIDFNKWCTYSFIELLPNYQSDIRKTIQTRMLVKLDKKSTNRHKCRKCNVSDATFIEYQARCADEASSFSLKCNNCRNVWRI